MTTDMLSVTGGTKIFYRGTLDERRALDGLDVSLKPGDFCIVIGSNGAGKSSFLNAVSGKLPLDSGRISIDGQDVTRLNAHRRAQFIARVFQDPMVGTAPTMTIGENMLLAELRGKPRGFSYGLTAARRARYSEQLAELNLGLEKRLDMQVGLLSGGQRQSLSLVMAVSTRPKLLLLDEHTAALDPRTAKLVMDTTVRAVEALQLTTLMVTHNMEHAIKYGNRIIMMDTGKVLVEIGQEEKNGITVADLIERFHTKSDAIALQGA
ncbi:putative ABC transport system ATP-binding protein [Phyllobacterium bourgognense]|uniref:Putative ABC transport system ATP-binding protein n=2 Tax=Phyllobacterium bourgognense TaxID=314236 RepID=A0A368YE95_9HYPH|nr:ABC transporter ATP-binding protein [Phyllobacterium bourgognense]RCW78475.1 putative ABC transport system ATP-binding protein [Phyllobacterium bourgognense]